MDGGTENAKLKGIIQSSSGSTDKTGGLSKLVNMDGSSDGEFDGLDLEERKRKRIGPALSEVMDTDNVTIIHKDSTFFKSDGVESNNTVLATLVQQASRPL